MRKILVTLCLAGALAASAAEAVLFSFDSTDGLRRGLGAGSPRFELEPVQGEGLATEGAAALRLNCRSGVAEGNHYVSVFVALPEPMDLRQAAVYLDARSSTPEAKAFYLRAYNRGESKPAWSFATWDSPLTAEWQTLRFQHSLCPEGLAWEAAVVEDRVASAVDRIELIIGTHEDETDIEAIFDNLRLGPPIGTLSNLTQVKVDPPETPLVRAGESRSLILHPSDPAGTAAAARLAEAIRARTGAAPACRPGRPDDAQPAEHAILLGTVDSNPALAVLYARRMTPVDSVCPGQGGALVHTVSDPFGKDANVIVAGAADEAGLNRAVDILIGVINAQPAGPDLALPRLFERAYGEDFLKVCSWADDEPAANRLQAGLAEGRSALDRGQHTSIAGVLARVADRYRFTGHSVEATLYVQLWDMYAASAVADPRKFGGPWGFDSDFPSRQVITGWDLIEDDPALSDEDRLRTVTSMGRWIAEAVVPEAASGARSTHVPHNHQTFPALGCLAAGLYLTQHYDLLEGKVWLGLADALFRRQATYFKPHEDCNGYQWLTNGHMFTYAVSRPDLTVFDNGNAGRIIDFCIGNMDNLGYQVPYGDTGSWACWNSEVICLDTMAYVTGSADALWAAQLKRQVKRLRPTAGEFERRGEAPVPTRFNGVQSWPLEPHHYASMGAPERPPLESCFDKITFRERMHPEALYLLLDGLSNGGHKHDDGNSIPRITAFERIWLADNDYFKSPLKYHNSMLVIRNGESAKIPPYVELCGVGESAAVGYSRTRVAAYAGADWERTVVWLKQARAFVVLDRLEAVDPGDFQFRLLWHGVGEAALQADGLALTQKGPGLWIQVAQGPRLSLYDDHDLGNNWNGYPHAAPVVRSLTAVESRTLRQGASHLFATVFHGSAEGPGEPWPMRFTKGLPGVVVTTPQGPVAIGVTPGEIATAEGRFRTDAEVVVAGPAGLSLLGASRADVDDEVLFTADGSRCTDLTDVPTANAVAGLPLAPLAPPAAAADALPALPEVWSITPTPQESLLTGNRNLPGAVADFATVHSDPAPAAVNVFSDVPNRLEALTDGRWDGTGDSVMYDPDQAVTLTIAMAREATLARVTWQQWWATTSSRKTAYLLARATVQGSNDGFEKDIRTLGTLAETGQHPDWGAPVTFDIALDNARAKDLRLVLEPRPGSAIYLGEILVAGRLPDGLDATGAYRFTSITPARLDTAGDPAVMLTTGEGDLVALNSDGAVRWTRRFPAQLNDLVAVDVDGDGRDELALARQDHRVALLDAEGAPRWERELQYYRTPPYVNLVRAGDLDGDGRPEIIAGGNNWRFYAYRADGEELWNYEAVHPSRSGAVADLDGDGKAEVLCGTHYYSMSVLNPDGTRRWAASFGPICFSIATGAFDGDGTRGVVCGSGDSGVYLFDARGQRRLACVTGDEVRCVATADLDGDGRDEALAGSLSHYVYCFDGQGAPRWRTDLGEPVAWVVTGRGPIGPLVLAGTTGGSVVTLDARGTPRARRRLDDGLTGLAAFGDDVIATTAAGRVLRLRPLP
ncbi:MAG: PQQ-binding-like beta-propeller repeat protein [Lentisphaerae bacterium]|nr:PQQ-binding-like beta-propeller repeat protein [Lentisphaerota bacterium]